MYPEDSIMCCLFPQKCNMFHRTPVIIFWDTVWYLNMIVITCLIILVVWSVVCMFIKFQSNLCRVLRQHDADASTSEPNVYAVASTNESNAAAAAAAAAEKTTVDEVEQNEVELNCHSFSAVTAATCSAESSSSCASSSGCGSGDTETSCGRDSFASTAVARRSAEFEARASSDTCGGSGSGRWSETKRDDSGDEDCGSGTQRGEPADARTSAGCPPPSAPPQPSQPSRSKTSPPPSLQPSRSKTPPPSLKSCSLKTTPPSSLESCCSKTPPSPAGQEHSVSTLKIHSSCSPRNAASAKRIVDNAKAAVRDNSDRSRAEARDAIDNDNVDCDEIECCEIDLLNSVNKEVAPTSAGGGHQYKLQLQVNDQLIPCDEGDELVRKLRVLPPENHRKNATKILCSKDATN